MEIGGFLNSTPATPIVAPIVNARRPAQESRQTQPGENPDETANGVVRSESAQPDQSETRRESEITRELKQRDREVRSHEQAHRNAGGDLVRGGGYEYQVGPDGRQYAIGGDVQIDTSPVSGDPEATLAKAERIRQAALAPAEPSQQDLRVAAQASAMAAQARADLRQYTESEDDGSQANGETDSGQRPDLNLYA